MGWTIWTAGAAVAAAALLVVCQLLHLAIVLQWSDAQTLGPTYYARPAAWRQRFKRLLQWHALVLSPVLALLRVATRPKFSRRRIVYDGVSGPAGACTPESFRRATLYEPCAEDVFVATQMRSGTTWMQHLVLQVLTRGRGDLARDGTALNALSPWLESIRTVDIQDAPLIGVERSARIVKTHLPATLCPWDPRARYLYVVRHPLACFASSADFVRNNLHGFAPSWQELAEWFVSDELMWFGSWVHHIAGWQRLADREANVLVVRYEDMQADLAAVARQVAALVGVKPLTEAELAAVLDKCQLDYMRRHADAFEMHPPHLLQTANAFFPSGRADRAQGIPPEIARQVLDACRSQCARQQIPLERLYPDLAPQGLKREAQATCEA